MIIIDTHILLKSFSAIIDFNVFFDTLWDFIEQNSRQKKLPGRRAALAKGSLFSHNLYKKMFIVDV